MPILIFAYGSNMDPVQMRQRCPGAETIGNGVLRDHRLCFPRLSDKRGCGVSSVEPAVGQEVWGVVYRLNATDLASLDGFEGYLADRPVEDNRYNRLAIRSKSTAYRPKWKPISPFPPKTLLLPTPSISRICETGPGITVCRRRIGRSWKAWNSSALPRPRPLQAMF